MGNEGESSQVVGMLIKILYRKTMPDAGIKGILFMPNLYLENGKVGRKEDRDGSRAWAEGYARNESCVCDESRTEVSARGLDCLYRSEESMGGRGGSSSLPRLRWERFGHACCVVGAAAHVARLDLSGDHLEDVWSL